MSEHFSDESDGNQKMEIQITGGDNKVTDDRILIDTAHTPIRKKSSSV